MAGHRHVRFRMHYDKWPYKWFGYAAMSSGEQDVFLQKLSITPSCCMDALFTRRVVNRVSHGHRHGSEGFLNALNSKLKSDMFIGVLASWDAVPAASTTPIV